MNEAHSGVNLLVLAWPLSISKSPITGSLASTGCDESIKISPIDAGSVFIGKPILHLDYACLKERRNRRVAATRSVTTAWSSVETQGPAFSQFLTRKMSSACSGACLEAPS